MVKRLFLFFLVLLITICGLSRTPSLSQKREIQVSDILNKTAEYCQRLDSASLHFICLETIKEKIYYYKETVIGRYRSGAFFKPTRFYKSNRFTYDYQLIRKGQEIIESRTLLEENGEKKNIKNAKLKTERFEHKYVFFGPIGLLNDLRQELFTYNIIGEEEFKGEKVIILEALPKKSSESIYLYGRVWINKHDFSIVKIDWNQASLGNFWGVWEYAKSIGAKPHIIFSSEYAFEKNGLRFPSKYTVKENYIHPIYGPINKSVTDVIYEDYKFFTVETEVRIK